MNVPLSLVLTFLLVIAIQGCATGSRSTAVGFPANATNPGGSSGAAATSILVSGDTDTAFGYTSASGKLCRRSVAVDSGDVTVSCQSESGEWEATRKLDGVFSDGALKMFASELSVESQTAEEPAELSLSEARPQEADGMGDVAEVLPSHDPEFERVKVLSGESLWLLAKRTTGSGENWQVISEANQLNDANHVRPGQWVQIPASLVLSK